jgi:hypothetical protein
MKPHDIKLHAAIRERSEKLREALSEFGCRGELLDAAFNQLERMERDLFFYAKRWPFVSHGCPPIDVIDIMLEHMEKNADLERAQQDKQATC